MRLIIPAEVEAKLHAYVSAVDTEIAGMGKAKVSPEGDIMLLDVAIYEQEVTGGTADLSSLALAKFQTELIQKGESPKDWIVWWHSHANMSAFFSGRDTSTIDSSNEFQYLVSLVVNKKRQREARVDTYQPFRFTKERLEIVVGTMEEVVPQEIKDEVALKVKIKSSGWEGGGGYGQGRLGFGKHKLLGGQTEGKGYPAASRSGSQNSQGGNSVVKTDRNTYLDRDEILTVIDAVRELMRGHEVRGTTESQEYSDLTEDVQDWTDELARRDEEDAIRDSVIDYNAKN